MNRTKLIQDELKALWWFSTNIQRDTQVDHLKPVTKSGAIRLPKLNKTHGKLFWTRGAAEALILLWAIREEGRQGEIYWEVGERGLVVFSGPPIGVYPDDCCLQRR